MLRSPPFNAQADCKGGEGARGATCCYPQEIPTSQHKERHSSPLWLPVCHRLLHEEMEALRAWRGDVRGACREPELDRSGLSMLQGWTRAQAPGQREQLPWWLTIEQVIVIDRLSMESKLAQVNAGKIHANGSGPSGLGMMQPEGHPQGGKLKT